MLKEDSTAAQPARSLKDVLRSCTCPACGHHVAVSFYDGGNRPLATLAWPRSAGEAQSMRRYPLSFVRCVDCGHVYNSDFDYAVVPYSDKPNLMFNQGAVWTRHLAHVRDLILRQLPPNPTVVEIGCGDGGLLRAMAAARPEGRYVGFDPNAAVDVGHGRIQAHQRMFDPAEHLLQYRPDVVISRHVFEHLVNPLGFVQALSFAASWQGVETRLFIEVPCIDRALAIGRTVDFFYEHNSNFTTRSLERLLQRCATSVELIERGYNDEVVYGLARFAKQQEQVDFAQQALAFRSRAVDSRWNVRRSLDALVAGGKNVAIWGGTGKAAAFIHQYELDAARFPVVVDSDPDKVGTFVPGTGQEIRFRDYLLDHPADIILIATQWRAPDIVDEIKQCGIPFLNILIEHDGRLTSVLRNAHPYRADEPERCRGPIGARPFQAVVSEVVDCGPAAVATPASPGTC